MKVTDIFKQMDEETMEAIEKASKESKTIYGLILRILKILDMKKFKTTENNECISAFTKEGFVVFGKDYQNKWVMRYHKKYKSPAITIIIE